MSSREKRGFCLTFDAILFFRIPQPPSGSLPRYVWRPGPPLGVGGSGGPPAEGETADWTEPPPPKIYFSERGRVTPETRTSPHRAAASSGACPEAPWPAFCLVAAPTPAPQPPTRTMSHRFSHGHAASHVCPSACAPQRSAVQPPGPPRSVWCPREGLGSHGALPP